MAYKLWRLEVIEAIKRRTSQDSAGLQAYNIWQTPSVVAADHGYHLHPGRIARQLLGMLLAIQADPSLCVENPQLRATYFDDTGGASISPMTLHVALANTNFGYFSSEVVEATLDLQSGGVGLKPMRLWSFSPFVVILSEDGSDPAFPALRVDEWLKHPVSYHFRKKDRHVGYPIAPRTDPLISLLYSNSSY